MNEIIFRAATVGDISELVKLRFMAILETDGVDQNQRTPEFEKMVREYFQEYLSNQTYFGAVAELDGRLVSNNGLILYRKPPAFKGTSGIVGYVTNVYTMPEFRNLGIASELMKLLISFAKHSGATKIHLGTTDEGRKLYEKHGFKDLAIPGLELRF
jgi:ribosomal protein S18 acetylase RimI-like enzyme